MAIPIKAVSTDVCVSLSLSFFFFAFSRLVIFVSGFFLQPTAHRPIVSLGVEAK